MEAKMKPRYSRQFRFGKEATPDWALRLFDRGPVVHAENRPAETVVTVATPDGPVDARDGDWIVEDRDGFVRVRKHDEATGGPAAA